MAQNQNITGRDHFLIVEALTFTIESWELLPDTHRPNSNIKDMKQLVEHYVGHDISLELAQAEARRRLKLVRGD